MLFRTTTVALFFVALTSSLSAQVITLTSQSPFAASPVVGTVTQQIAILNSGVPVAPYTTQVLVGGNFCGGVCQDIPGVPEVSLNNQNSAFYRFTFHLPTNFGTAELSGIAVVDDQATLFLNGHPITLPMTSPSDWGNDISSNGVAMLTWPTIDEVYTNDSSLFVEGTNELLFAVCGDCSVEPTGIEFEFTISYHQPFIRGDVDDNGTVDLIDVLLTLDYLFGITMLTMGCLDALDADDSGHVDLVDAIHQLYSLFVIGAPPLPVPNSCGTDPTLDTLYCPSPTCP